MTTKERTQGRQAPLLLTRASPESEPHRSRGGTGFQLGGSNEEQPGSLEGAASPVDDSGCSEAVEGVGGGGGGDDSAKRVADHHLGRGSDDSRLRVDGATPVALTQGEHRAFRMGGLEVLALVASSLAPGGAARRVEKLRIRIAARSIPFDGPEFWPTRGA